MLMWIPSSEWFFAPMEWFPPPAKTVLYDSLLWAKCPTQNLTSIWTDWQNDSVICPCYRVMLGGLISVRMQSLTVTSSWTWDSSSWSSSTVTTTRGRETGVVLPHMFFTPACLLSNHFEVYWDTCIKKMSWGWGAVLVVIEVTKNTAHLIKLLKEDCLAWGKKKSSKDSKSHDNEGSKTWCYIAIILTFRLVKQKGYWVMHHKPKNLICFNCPFKWCPCDYFVLSDWRWKREELWFHRYAGPTAKQKKKSSTRRKGTNKVLETKSFKIGCWLSLLQEKRLKREEPKISKMGRSFSF